MKKFVLTLTIMLFTFGAFATNGIIKIDNLNSKTTTQLVEEDLSSCTTTYIITIDHGTWIETITITETGPCPFD